MDEEVNHRERSDGDRFDHFMFGRGRIPHHDTKKEEKGRNSSSPDIGTILENFDTLMESAQNLKPLITKVYPLVERLWKKN